MYLYHSILKFIIVRTSDFAGNLQVDYPLGNFQVRTLDFSLYNLHLESDQGENIVTVQSKASRAEFFIWKKYVVTPGLCMYVCLVVSVD